MPYVTQDKRPELDNIVSSMISSGFNANEDLADVLHQVTNRLPNATSYIAKVMMDVGVQANGDLNYILYKYCLMMVKPSYNNYKRYIGALEDASYSVKFEFSDWRYELRECAAEIRRRLLGPYEDSKIQENGDVNGQIWERYWDEH